MTTAPLARLWIASTRRVPPLLLAALIALYPATARAQKPEEEPEKKSDDPVPSYLYFGAISAAVIFIVCKSARR